MKNAVDRSIAHSKPWIKEEDIRAVTDVLSSGMVAQGQKVAEFEQAVASYLGLAGGVATSSGTIALFLSFKALKVGPGDEVIIPTYVCPSVYKAVEWTGAIPVLCDSSDDWCINIDTVRPRITKRTRAIVVVHTFGISADIEPIVALGIPVIEDCAQAFGGIINSRRLGSFGVFCICSFHATKLLCTGEGGMVLSHDRDFINSLKKAVDRQGSENKVAYRFPMSDIQAGLGLSQLRRYETFLERRRKIAYRYFAEFRNLPVQLPNNVLNRSIFFRFPIRGKFEFEAVREAFEKEGVHIRRGVDSLLHRSLKIDPRDFPDAERCYAETLSIPLYPSLSDEGADHITVVCQRILSKP